MLKDYMNKLNQIDPFCSDVADAIQGEITLQDNSADQLLEDNYFDTCSEAVLEIYEKEAGIKTKSSVLADRRSAVTAKWLASNVASLQSIKDIADRWSYGKVNLDYSDLTLTVSFVDKGIPSGLSDLKEAIEEAIPAHIAVNYVFSYNTWADVSTQKWSAVSTKTWGELYGG